MPTACPTGLCWLAGPDQAYLGHSQEVDAQTSIWVGASLALAAPVMLQLNPASIWRSVELA